MDITDSDIAAMTPVQRRELIERLARPIEELVTGAAQIERVRRARLWLIFAGSIGLIPWIVFLALTLPNDYIATNWNVTWAGFDGLLLLSMLTTGFLAWKRRRLVVLATVATGVLLICDAWFDIMTAQGSDVWLSVATAVLLELPLAAVMINGALRIYRLMAGRLWMLDEGKSVWTLELPSH